MHEGERQLDATATYTRYRNIRLLDKSHKGTKIERERRGVENIQGDMRKPSCVGIDSVTEYRSLLRRIMRVPGNFVCEPFAQLTM